MTLSSVTGQQMWWGQEIDFFFDTFSNTYRHYRMVITAVRASTNARLTEIWWRTCSSR